MRKVKRVQFGILGPEELKQASVVNITTDRTFENGRPVPGGEGAELRKFCQVNRRCAGVVN